MLPDVDLPQDTKGLTALYRIAHLGGETTEPHAVLRQILHLIIEAVGGVSGDVSLVNPDTGQLEVEISQSPRGAGDDELRMRLGQGITGWVALHGQPQHVHDVSADPRYVQLRDHVHSEMAAPLLSEHGQVMGVINIDGDRVGAFSDDDFALLQTLTTEATRVISRHWERANFSDKARQLESLITIGQSLVTQLEPQELHTSITRDARQIIGLRAGALYLHDHEAATVRLVAYDGPEETHCPEGPVPLDSSLVATAISTRKSVECANVQAPELIDVDDLPSEPGLRSLLATPLLIDGEVLGVLAVFTAEIHRFTNDEKRLLSALSSLGAVALQNSRLYARVFQSEAHLRKHEQLTTLGLLAAEIAHEIRNPLTVLKLLFGTLQLDYADDDPRATDARVIREKIDELEGIVSRVLSLAKTPTNRHSRENVAELIDDALLLIRLKLRQSKIKLDYQRPSVPFTVEVHKGQLQQVLLNLLLNATQAMPTGGRISLELRPEPSPEGGEQICIDVSDTGPGIPPELSERIFESFLSSRADGTGLGLAIAKRILASHHGDILLHQTSPAGTTMRIVLPLVPSA
jgi:signal transduction histidine kinase